MRSCLIAIALGFVAIASAASIPTPRRRQLADYSAGAAQQGAGKAALEATGTVVNTNKNKEEVKGNESNTGSKAGVKTNDGETKASEEERIKAIAAKNKKWGDELLNKSQENENKTFHEIKAGEGTTKDAYHTYAEQYTEAERAYYEEMSKRAKLAAFKAAEAAKSAESKHKEYEENKANEQTNSNVAAMKKVGTDVTATDKPVNENFSAGNK